MRWLILLLCLSCSQIEDRWQNYEITEGDHYSHVDGYPLRIFRLEEGRHVAFIAYFDSDCIYAGNDDINKLYGFTDCNSLVHENSTRFGWRVAGDTIQIFAYWYNDSKNGYQRIGETIPWRVDHYDMWAKGDSYQYTFNGKTIGAPRGSKCSHGIRERLFPYFGGSNTAPHTMHIHIREN